MENGVAFVVDESGLVRRLAPATAAPLIERLVNVRTGDDHLDGLINTALARFTSRTPAERQVALEKLWDAFERTKDLAAPGKTKQSVAIMLNNAGGTSGPVRAELEQEARSLTDAGNTLGIRHHGLSQAPISDPRVVDWLFVRCSGLILLMLEANGYA